MARKNNLGQKYVSGLLRYSDSEMAVWGGMGERISKKVNDALSALGLPRKLLPISYILQLAEMGVRNPVCSLIWSKAGISLYRMESEGRRFIYTNLIVAKEQESAFMFDYNLLGKGIAYGDLRNVTSSLLPETAEAFLEEYGAEGMEEQKLADAVISPLVTLFLACGQEKFPEWAQGSLEELKNGEILKFLNDWLSMEATY